MCDRLEICGEIDDALRRGIEEVALIRRVPISTTGFSCSVRALPSAYQAALFSRRVSVSDLSRQSECSAECIEKRLLAFEEGQP